MHRDRRFFLRLILGIAALLCVGIFSIQTVQGIQLVFSLRTAVEQGEYAASRSDIKGVKEAFERASLDSDDLSTLLLRWKVVEILPLLGSQYEGVRHASAGATHLARAGFLAAQSIEVILEPVHTQNGYAFSALKQDQKKEMLNRLIQTQTALASAHTESTLGLRELAKADSTPSFFFVKSFIHTLFKKGERLEQLLEQSATIADALPFLAGTNEERTYLFLLQNTHEVRATGGFIGTFGIAKVRDGTLVSLKTDNVYNLDDAALGKIFIRPPEPFLRYFLPHKERLWFLRDSNWSPDFPTAARMAAGLYTKEGGTEKLDGVIALTPEVIASLLKITGPIEVEGEIYKGETFHDQLHYQVEKGFYRAGLPEAQRKEVIGVLAERLLGRFEHIGSQGLFESGALLLSHFYKKNILLFTFRDDVQESVRALGIAGEVRKSDGDFLMVVDSNLGSMKTDRVMEKNISTHLEERNGVLTARVTLHYTHTGSYAWDITAYRDFVRVLVPEESVFLRASGFGELGGEGKGTVEIEREHDKIVFGSLIVVPPGSEKTAIIEYALPERISKTIREKGTYSLLVQKQSGISSQQFYGRFVFSRDIVSVQPQGAFDSKAGMRAVDVSADLLSDREVTIHLK